MEFDLMSSCLMVDEHLGKSDLRKVIGGEISIQGRTIKAEGKMRWDSTSTLRFTKIWAGEKKERRKRVGRQQSGCLYLGIRLLEEAGEGKPAFVRGKGQ